MNAHEAESLDVPDEQSFVHPMPGQTLMIARDLGPDYDAEADTGHENTTNLREANTITSQVMNTGVANLHRVVLDIDRECTVIPSTSPGHYHLYIDAVMPWEVYSRLLAVLAEAGVIEPGYNGASQERGYTRVRLPWIKKELQD